MMKLLTYLVLIVLLVSALLPAAQPATAQAPITRTLSFQNGVAPTAGYAGGRDTYIAQARPNTVFSGERILRLDGDDPPGTGQDLSTLLYWDISAIPPGSTVKEVTLEFTVTNTAAGSYAAFELKQDWTENESSWVNRNAASPWQVPGANGTEDRGTDILGDLAPRASKASFGFYPPALAVVQRWVDDPSSNHGLILLNSNQSDGAAMVSNQDANAANHPKLTVVFDTPNLEPTPVGENQPPTVNAGEDFDVIGFGFTLHGTVTDDGLPADPGKVTYHWDVILAYPYTQEPIQFDENDLNTFVSFPKYGRIGFRLTATDGEHTVSDEVYVNVLPEPDQVNDAPSIYNFEGPLEVRLPNTGKYAIETIDDGLPIPPNALTFTWSTASGPAPATFSDPHSQVVTVTFSEPGTYVLQVEVSDGEKSVTGTREVKVIPELPVGENRPPSVNAGEDFEIVGEFTFSLQGSVTDDGLPADPGQVTYSWDRVSAPYTTEPIHLFETESLTPTVEVPKYGYYVFRLTATDGEDTITDDVRVSVLPEPGTVNQGPGVYSLGGPQEVRLPNTGQYSVYPIDDGLPMPPGDITFTWSTASGPAPVTFSDPHERIVNATFAEPGDYVLQIELSDGELTDVDRYEVKVLGQTLESVTVHFQQGRAPTSSYSGARDTYLSQQAPTSNFGSGAKLRVDGDDPPGTGRDLSTLFYWDIESFPGDPERIVEAAITIYVTNPSRGPFYLYALNKSWSESQATWQQAVSGDPWSGPGATDITAPDSDRQTAVLAIFKPTRTAFYTVRLTSEGINYLKDVLNDRIRNDGLILTHPNTTDGLDFYSRNYSNPKYRPVLSIRYEVAD